MSDMRCPECWLPFDVEDDRLDNGYYNCIGCGATSSEIDAAWFRLKCALWDVWGTPLECVVETLNRHLIYIGKLIKGGKR